MSTVWDTDFLKCSEVESSKVRVLRAAWGRLTKDAETRLEVNVEGGGEKKKKKGNKNFQRSIFGMTMPFHTRKFYSLNST